MNALITGGAGFIGSNVASYLVKMGWRVRVFDNLSSGDKRNIDEENVDFVYGNICDFEALVAACKGCDVVFHLAASVGRQKSIDDPQGDSMVNVIGTINLLEAMKLNGVNRIVYSSSAAIFGELIAVTIDESHPQNPDSPYGISKLAAEKLVLAYSELYQINAVCLRYFNIYGKNQRFDLYGNVIPIFANSIFSGRPITIYGNGEQTRDFLNVRDVTRANYLAATTGIGTGVYNLGSGTSITINKLAEMLNKMAGSPVPLNYMPRRPADVMHCKAEVKKIRSVFGFEPSVSLDEGLAEFMDWFRLDILGSTDCSLQ